MAAPATSHHFDGQLGLPLNQPVWSHNNYKRQQLLNAVCRWEDGGWEGGEEEEMAQVQNQTIKEISALFGDKGGRALKSEETPRFEEMKIHGPGLWATLQFTPHLPGIRD